MKKIKKTTQEGSANAFAKVDTDYALAQLFSSANRGESKKTSTIVSIELNRWLDEKGRTKKATADIYCHRQLTIRDETILYGILSLAEEGNMLKKVSHDNTSEDAKKTRDGLELSGAYTVRTAGQILTTWTDLYNHTYFKEESLIGGKQIALLKDTIKTLALTGIIITDKINKMEHSTRLLSYHTCNGELAIGINPDFFSVLTMRNRYTSINTRKRLQIQGDFGKECYRDLCARLRVSDVADTSEEGIRQHGTVVIAESIIKKLCGEDISAKTVANNKTALKHMLDSVGWAYFRERGTDNFGNKVTKFHILRTTQV